MNERKYLVCYKLKITSIKKYAKWKSSLTKKNHYRINSFYLESCQSLKYIELMWNSDATEGQINIIRIYLAWLIKIFLLKVFYWDSKIIQLSYTLQGEIS